MNVIAAASVVAIAILIGAFIIASAVMPKQDRSITVDCTWYPSYVLCPDGRVIPRDP
jgi:hypothetical protein